MYFNKLNTQTHVDFIHIVDTRMCFIVLHHTIAPRGPGPPHCRGFSTTNKHTTVDRTALDE